MKIAKYGFESSRADTKKVPYINQRLQTFEAHGEATSRSRALIDYLVGGQVIEYSLRMPSAISTARPDIKQGRGAHTASIV